MAGFGVDGYRDRIPCPHCGSTDCCGMSPDATNLICVRTNKIVTDTQLKSMAEEHGIKIREILMRGVGTYNPQVYQLTDGRFVIRYQGERIARIIGKKSILVKQVRRWIRYREEVVII